MCMRVFVRLSVKERGTETENTVAIHNTVIFTVDVLNETQQWSQMTKLKLMLLRPREGPVEQTCLAYCSGQI